MQSKQLISNTNSSKIEINLDKSKFLLPLSDTNQNILVIIWIKRRCSK